MKHGLSPFVPALLAALAVPSFSWADARPDFDDDAKPILKVQPNLIRQVESLYEVKDSGEAKYPGDDDHRAMPPYIFAARPRGSDGPFYLRLLIQPGPPGRILRVVDMRQVRAGQPGVPPAPPPPGDQAPPSYQGPPTMSPEPPPPAPPPIAQAPARQAPAPPPTPTAPAQPPTEPTADTPSGPIMDSGSQTSPASAPSSPSLEPPPDPAPAAH